MTKSSPETTQAPAETPIVSTFSLWPLPELARARGQASVAPSSEAPKLEETAYARGYDTGRTEAMDEANRTIKRAAGLLVSTAEALDAARLTMIRELEDSVYLLSLAVARHLIEREVQADPTVVQGLVQRALEAFPVGSRVEIHLNPEDLAALHSQFGLPSHDGRAADLQWISDPTIERGGCTLETPHRIVDGRVDMALRDLYQRLRDD
jgi:flagellar biosynthesis/type III secretory pathway protein FliH